MLDRDLAMLYGVETKALKQAMSPRPGALNLIHHRLEAGGILPPADLVSVGADVGGQMVSPSQEALILIHRRLKAGGILPPADLASVGADDGKRWWRHMALSPVAKWGNHSNLQETP